MGKRFAGFCLAIIIAQTVSVLNGHGQITYNTVVSGRVTDARTKEPLHFVSVILENTTIGINTDADGKYRIVTEKAAYKVKFSYLGYETASFVITPGKTQTVNAALVPASFELGEIVVKPKKTKYSNKENPSVDLIRRIIDNKDLNRARSLDWYNYKKYEKVVFSLSNLSEDFKKSPLFKKYQFVFENTDTTRLDGKQTLPVYITESVSDYYFRRIPGAVKEIIKAEKTINFSEYIDNNGITSYLGYLYQNIDIYDNEIFFLTNNFLSPIAVGAPLQYKYFIMDTTLVNNVKCTRIFFEPRNPADFLFHGFLFVTADSALAITKIDMSFNKGINIDWIKDVRIVQEFRKINNTAWVLTSDEVSVEFGVTLSLPGALGQRIVTRDAYSINEPVPDSIFSTPVVERKTSYRGENKGYWDMIRQPPLNKHEENLYRIVDSVKTVPGFRNAMKIVMLLTTSFWEYDKWELGPVGSFYSYNPVEGSRIRIGGRTREALSKTFFLESFIAYGFKDKLPKYSITGTYALNHKSIYTFPVKSIKINYKYDTQIPGQDLDYSEADNFFLSFTRGVNDKLFYNRTLMIEHINEFENHFSFAAGYNITRQYTGGNLHFVTDVFVPPVHTEYETEYINIFEPYVKLRYAPGEQFYQGKLYRDRVPSTHPIFQLQYSLGSQNLGNDYNYNKLYFSATKRFWLSIIGYTDVSVEAAKVFGQASWPVLFIHNANQSYAYQRYSYNMMNFLEFVSDQYVSLNIDHSFNGFFFNKIPLLKKLKFREVATLKVLYGGVTDKNNPDLNPDLFNYPVANDGTPLTFTLERKPYIEASIGCSNILRIFRVDLIKRITYLDQPNVSSLGVRVQFRFDF
jgi:hypothetical protein